MRILIVGKKNRSQREAGKGREWKGREGRGGEKDEEHDPLPAFLNASYSTQHQEKYPRIFHSLIATVTDNNNKKNN